MRVLPVQRDPLTQDGRFERVGVCVAELREAVIGDVAQDGSRVRQIVVRVHRRSSRVAGELPSLTEEAVQKPEVGGVADVVGAARPPSECRRHGRALVVRNHDR